MSIWGWIYRIGYPCKKYLVNFFFRPKCEGICAIVRREEEVLLIKQSYRTSDWCLVGGGIDPGEEPHDACIREVGEEVGLQALSVVEFYSFLWKKEYKRDIVHAFSVVTTGEPQVDGHEVIEAQWFKFCDLPENLDDIAREIIREYASFMHWKAEIQESRA